MAILSYLIQELRESLDLEERKKCPPGKHWDDKKRQCVQGLDMAQQMRRMSREVLGNRRGATFTDRKKKANQKACRGRADCD